MGVGVGVPTMPMWVPPWHGCSVVVMVVGGMSTTTIAASIHASLTFVVVAQCMRGIVVSLRLLGVGVVVVRPTISVKIAENIQLFSTSRLTWKNY